MLSGNDTANGSTGAEELRAYAGNDTLDGKAGADTMAGGAGDDTYVVDNSGDVVIEAAGEGLDLVQSSISFTLPDNLEKLTLSGSSSINATGNGTGNQLTGNSANNTLEGAAGNDTLDGGSGTDTATYSGNRADYTITAIGNGYTIADSVTGRDGTDTVYAIEKLQFADVASMNLGSNNTPTLATPLADQSTTAHFLFSHTLATGGFSDVDSGDSLSFSARLADGNALPSWLRFDSATGTFSGTPTYQDFGNLPGERHRHIKREYRNPCRQWRISGRAAQSSVRPAHRRRLQLYRLRTSLSGAR